MPGPACCAARRRESLQAKPARLERVASAIRLRDSSVRHALKYAATAARCAAATATAARRAATANAARIAADAAVAAGPRRTTAGRDTAAARRRSGRITHAAAGDVERGDVADLREQRQCRDAHEAAIGRNHTRR